MFTSSLVVNKVLRAADALRQRLTLVTLCLCTAYLPLVQTRSSMMIVLLLTTSLLLVDEAQLTVSGFHRYVRTITK